MKKYLTYRNAAILGYIGFSLLVASFFFDGFLDHAAWAFGLLFTVISLTASYHEKGYKKGKTEALKVEITRVWSEQEPFTAKTSGVYNAKDWTPVTEQDWLGNTPKPDPLEAELNKALAADKADDLHEPVSAYAPRFESK